jgi:ubiquinone/menaquinone biosynthesis C-methylase UbiE
MKEIDPDRKTRAWDDSYARRENHVFYPGDEAVRFVSRYIRRRTGLCEFQDVLPDAQGSKVLDVGCGIGRTLVFGTHMGLRMHGTDLSANAVAVAREWLESVGEAEVEERVVAGDIRSLPWADGFFDHAISDSVLDSMPFQIAQAGMSEIARVVRQGGYFYCSLISGDESGKDPQFCGELVVTGVHEQNTIQSYFNKTKIRRLVEPLFEIVSCALHEVRDDSNKSHHGRWHVVARRR